MKAHLIITLVLSASILSAQRDSIPPGKPLLLEQKINNARLELKSAFLASDPAAAGLWQDSLMRLEDETYIGLNWDERWLLYFWQENYGTLLTEASQLGADERTALSYKVPPPNDSLFEVIDQQIFEQRYQLFQNIRHAFLNEEEKAFTTLLLEYLLRMNTNEEEWAERIEAFETQYASSKFLYFLRSVKPDILKPANKGIGISMSFLSGSWSKQLDRSLNPLYALHVDLYYWVARWNVSVFGIFGGPKLARDIEEGLDVWPKDDPTSYAHFGLELGYDILNKEKFRIYPAVNGSLGFLNPPSPDEDSDEEQPAYYDSFYFVEGNAGVSLTADIKLFRNNFGDWGLPKGSYHGIRMRVGYNWLNFGKDNPMLKGNLFYFTIGYNLFGFRQAKK